MSARSREEARETQHGFPVQGEVAVLQLLVEGVHGVQAVGPPRRDGAVDEVTLGQPSTALVQPGEKFGDFLVVVGLVGDDGDLLLTDVVHLLQALHPCAELRGGVIDPGRSEHLVVLHVLLQQGGNTEQERVLALDRARVDELLGAHIEAQVDQPAVCL